MIINGRRSSRPSFLHIAQRGCPALSLAYCPLCTNCHRSSCLYANCLSVLIGSAAECVNYLTDG